jgi:hypothetical protein
MSNGEVVSNAWLEAISLASACLHTNGHRANTETMIDVSLASLVNMEKILLNLEDQWDNPPSFPPPSTAASGGNAAGEQVRGQIPIAIPPLNGNRFASIQYGDDSSDDEEQDMDDGGDVPMLNHTPLPPKQDGMSMRRLMIRIVSTQSDIFARKGCNCSFPPPRWVPGADFYQISLYRIHNALALADSEISRLLEKDARQCSELEEDADIVAVSVGLLTKECSAFKRAGEARKQRLLKKLNPQWGSRDMVKSAWGERWTNNPNPHNRQADMRKQDEQELREIEAALLKMSAMDTDKAQQEVERLKSRVQVRGKRKAKKSNAQRYNGIRPSHADRVSWELYPDPAEFGWMFTGSDEFVEFFEKDEIKLDWYFTTATMKTSMNHPKHGHTQMFGSRVTPEMYIKILLNPREHTNKRYRTRANKPRTV